MATTRRQRQEKDTLAQPLLLALDLGLKTWKLGFARDFSDTPWVREIAGGDGEALLKTLAQAKRHFKLPATVPVRSCYEAGPMAFGSIAFWRSAGCGIWSWIPPVLRWSAGRGGPRQIGWMSGCC